MKEVIRICIFGILLILAGCRSESLVEADELYREQIDKIKFFENYEKDKNHRYDEKWLNYEDTSNPAIPFSQSLKTLLVNRPEVAEVIKKHYGEIYWEATSVLMESEEGDKVVYYPIIGKGKDKNKYVLKSIVNKNHTYLRFEIQTKEKEKLASQMIDDFSKYLNDDEVMESRCVDRNGIPTCDIDAVEIIGRKNRGITVPLPPSGLAPANPPYYWDIGEGRYVGIECMNIGGCGSSLPLPIPPPMDNNNPCEKATNGKNIANNLIKNPTIKQKMDAVLRGKLGANNEWAIAIGQNPDGSYSVSDAVEGKPLEGKVPEVPSGNYVADGHTHRGSGGPSGGDFYGMLGIMKDNLHYTTRFVYGIHHGSQELYALVITDRNLAMQFLSQYPRRENYDEEVHIFRRDTNLGKDFHKMYQTINKGYYNYEQHQNNYSTEAIALAYILEKYNTGIALVKQDKNGNFQPFRVKEVPNYPISGSDGKKTTGANVSNCP